LLVELSISSFAIIDSLRLEFSSGLSILTGETGTGKSIIIDAMILLLGGRAHTGMIRTGCDRAFVEGVFVPPSSVLDALAPILDEHGLSHNEGQLILRREISRGRRNISRVNGQAVTLGILQAIGQHLVDIHGQGDHLSLLDVRQHVRFLDRYGGLDARRNEFSQLTRDLASVRREKRSLQRDERELARRMDLLKFQCQEIRAARLVPGEQEELRRQRSLLASAEKRMELASLLHTLLAEGDGEQTAVSDLLGEAMVHLNDLAELDSDLQEESHVIENMVYELEEFSRMIRNYRDEVEYSPEDLREVEDRLELIVRLERKYGDTIEDVLQFLDRAEIELDGIQHRPSVKIASVSLRTFLRPLSESWMTSAWNRLVSMWTFVSVRRQMALLWTTAPMLLIRQA